MSRKSTRSTNNSTSKQQQNNLVQTWLGAIGLAPHVLETFDAAGIVNPKDLAELEVSHYPALGVTEAGDRKKLFYLVQRVKMAVPETEDEEEEDEEDNEDEEVNNGSLQEWHRGKEEKNLIQNGGEKINEKRRSAPSDSEDDKIEKALEEQYRPLLMPSSSDDDESYEDAHSHTTSSSEEETPAPPPSPPAVQENDYSQFSVSSKRSYLSNKSTSKKGTDSPTKSSDSDLSPDKKSLTLRGFIKKKITEAARSFEDLSSKQSSKKQNPHELMAGSSGESSPEKKAKNPISSRTSRSGGSIGSSSRANSSRGRTSQRKINISTSNGRKITRGSLDMNGRTTKVSVKKTKKASEIRSKENGPNGNEKETNGRPVLERREIARTSNVFREDDLDKVNSPVNLLNGTDTDISYDMDFEDDDMLSNDSPNRSPIRRVRDEFKAFNEDVPGSKTTKITPAIKDSPVGKRRTSKRLQEKRQKETLAQEEMSKSSNTSSKRDKRKSKSASSTDDFDEEIMTSKSLDNSTLSSRSSRHRKSVAKNTTSRNRPEKERSSSRGSDDFNASFDKEVDWKLGTSSSKASTESNESGRDRRSKIPATQRVSKRLSSIPSDRVALMSPPAALSPKELEEAVASVIEDDNLSSRSSSSRGSKKSEKRRSRSSGSGLSTDLNTSNGSASFASSSRNSTNSEHSIEKGFTTLSKPSDGSSRRKSNNMRKSSADDETISSNHSSSSRSSKANKKSLIGSRSKSEQNGGSVSFALSSRNRCQSDDSFDDQKGRVSDPFSGANRAKSTPKIRTKSPTNARNTAENTSMPILEIQDSRSFDGFDKKGKGNSQRKSTGAAVFVHGKVKPQGWASQVAELRDENNEIHKEAMKNKNEVIEEEMRIRVIVRKRPMSRKEAAKRDDVNVIHPLQYESYGRIMVYQAKTRVDLTREVETIPFAFDNVFEEKASNFEIYRDTIRNLVPGVFEGRWASVFAYGQTGSGKTFTMMGSSLTGIKAGNRHVNHNENFGLYYLAAQDVFKFARREEFSHLSVGASLFEIYGGKLFDLLNKRSQVRCLEDQHGKVCFPGLSEHPVSNADELINVIEEGSANRSTGSTSANRDSSRSHAVLQLHLRKSNGRKSDVEHGRLTFIDLAGSERGADTSKACRTTRLEGAEINTSLLALKEVIRALATGDKMTHVPFRGSKLTQVLKESFVGKHSRTVMVACVAPNMTNCEHTLNTLRYADRVKERNPETGKLTAKIAAASKIEQKVNSQPLKNRPITAPPAGSDLDRVNSQKSLTREEDDYESSDGEHKGVEDNWLSDLDDEGVGFETEEQNTTSDAEDEFDELNEVLRSPVNETLKAMFTDESLGNSSCSKKEAVAPLVTSHRAIMTEMLSMVKKEMTLVNCTDADRALVDDYLHELEEIQEKQLSMISSLRESLVEYYAKRPQSANFVPGDTSFDDLRLA